MCARTRHQVYTYSRILIKPIRRSERSRMSDVSISPPIYFIRFGKKSRPLHSRYYSALVPCSFAYSPMGVYYRNVLKHCGHEAAGLNLDTLPLSTRKIRALARTYTRTAMTTLYSRVSPRVYTKRLVRGRGRGGGAEGVGEKIHWFIDGRVLIVDSVHSIVANY